MESENTAKTREHIMRVARHISDCIRMLLIRAEYHDFSKLQEPEVSIFEDYTKKLETTEYGSDEYKEHLKAMKPALDHHYANNRHHPEFHADGVEGMTLIDLMEMLCDWMAACARHPNGDIMESISINEKRFSIPPCIAKILRNTIERWPG